jgi:hypothetical protein
MSEHSTRKRWSQEPAYKSWIEKVAKHRKLSRRVKPDPAVDLCDAERGFCTGHKEIPRRLMPQIYNTRRFARTIKRKYGIKSHMEMVRPDSLTPSQEEIKKSVVKKIGEAMAAGKYKDSPIVISKNKHVIDGHHRWASRKKYAPTKKIRALVVHKKAMDVLGIAAAEGQPRESF